PRVRRARSHRSLDPAPSREQGPHSRSSPPELLIGRDRAMPPAQQPSGSASTDVRPTVAPRNERRSTSFAEHHGHLLESAPPVVPADRATKHSSGTHVKPWLHESRLTPSASGSYAI